MNKSDVVMNIPSFLMKMHMELCVPLLIDELAERGGPDEDDYLLLTEISEEWKNGASMIGAFIREGEMPGTGKIDRKVLTRIAEGLAVMAFLPGGVSFLGSHFDAEANITSQYHKKENR